MGHSAGRTCAARPLKAACPRVASGAQKARSPASRFLVAGERLAHRAGAAACQAQIASASSAAVSGEKVACPAAMGCQVCRRW